MRDALITIFGGTGFLGTHLVRELAKTGALIRVACRDPQGGQHIKTSGYVGQITLEKASILDKDAVARAVAGSDMVVNLVGVLFESGGQRFANVQAQGAERIAKAARDAGVKKLVHVSALGVDKATKSKYARTKLAGEKAVSAAFPHATILRPSIVFGPEDKFFNRFAEIAMLAPFMPLIGGGRTQFQPVYVVDVARAIHAALALPNTHGRTYEIGGAERYRFEELLEFIMDETGHRRPFFPIPFALAGLMGAVMEWLPNPPLTYDQVQLLRVDNVVSDKALTLADLGVEPASIESVVPHYLWRYRRGGQFATEAHEA